MISFLIIFFENLITGGNFIFGTVLKMICGTLISLIVIIVTLLHQNEVVQGNVNFNGTRTLLHVPKTKAFEEDGPTFFKTADDMLDNHSCFTEILVILHFCSISQGNIIRVSRGKKVIFGLKKVTFKVKNF